MQVRSRGKLFLSQNNLRPKLQVWIFCFICHILSIFAVSDTSFSMNISGTLVVSTYVGCPDIRLNVTPDLKCSQGRGKIIFFLFCPFCL